VIAGNGDDFAMRTADPMTVAGLEVDALSRLPRVAIARFRESLDPSLRRHRQTHPGSLR
jgi:hypothetical protein